MIRLLVTLFVVIPVQLFVVLPLKVFGVFMKVGGHLFGSLVRLAVLPLKLIGWVVWLITLPLRILTWPLRVLFG